MKRLLYLIPLLAVLLAVGCNPEENSSIEGQWYCYEQEGLHTRLYLELKDGKADLIITAWGDRYKGTYTYSESEKKLTINYTTTLARGNAGELGQNATLTSNLFNDWPSATSADHVLESNPIVMGFEVDGDNAVCDFVGLIMPMTRKK